VCPDVIENKSDTLIKTPIGEWVLVRRQWPGTGMLEAGSDLYHAVAVDPNAPLPDVDLEMCLRLAAISSISGPGGFDTAETGDQRRKAISEFISRYGPLGIAFRQVRDDERGVFMGESEARWWRESFDVWKVLHRAKFLKLITVSKKPVRKGASLWWLAFTGDSGLGLASADETAAARTTVLDDLRDEITEKLREHTKLALSGDSLPLSIQIEANTPRGRIWRFLAEFVTGGLPVHLKACAGGCGTLLIATAQRGRGLRADAKWCGNESCRKRSQRAKFLKAGLTSRGTPRKRAPNRSSRKGNNDGKA
jgi:hypothetical protein